MDEDVLEELDEKLELDYQVGEDLKERVSHHNPYPQDLIYTNHMVIQIIPRAVDYFTGKALEYEDLADLDDDEDYEDIDDDEDGYDDDVR